MHKKLAESPILMQIDGFLPSIVSVYSSFTPNYFWFLLFKNQNGSTLISFAHL